MSGVPDRDEVAAVYAAARERLEGRRNPDRDPYSRRERREADLDGAPLPPFDVFAPPWRAARTAGEGLDDVVLRFGSPLNSCPEHRVVAVIAVAARESAEAAVAAVRRARALTAGQQWAVRENLRALQADQEAVRFGTASVLAAVLAEWSRLRLQETDPAQAAAPRRRRRSWEAGVAAS